MDVCLGVGRAPASPLLIRVRVRRRGVRLWFGSRRGRTSLRLPSARRQDREETVPARIVQFLFQRRLGRQRLPVVRKIRHVRRCVLRRRAGDHEYFRGGRVGGCSVRRCLRVRQARRGQVLLPGGHGRSGRRTRSPRARRGSLRGAAGRSSVCVSTDCVTWPMFRNRPGCRPWSGAVSVRAGGVRCGGPGVCPALLCVWPVSLPDAGTRSGHCSGGQGLRALFGCGWRVGGVWLGVGLCSPCEEPHNRYISARSHGCPVLEASTGLRGRELFR